MVIPQLTQAWHWWVSELTAMLPASWRSRPDVLVDVLDDMLVVHGIESTPVHIHRAAAVPLNAAGRRVIVRLPAAMALRRLIQLPLASDRTLGKVLAFEIERLSPVEPEAIYWDQIVTARHRAAKRMDVEVYLARRSVADDAVAACRALGLAPDAVGVVGAPAAIAFLAGAKRQRASRLPGPATVLTALGLGLLAAAAGTGAVRDMQALDALTAMVDNERSEASQVNQLRREVFALRDRAAFLPGLRQAHPVSAVIAEVTRLVPDGAWLFQLEANGKDLRLRGFSPDAARLVAVFDGSALFTNARFRAPLTKGPRDDLERFDLSVDIRGANP